MRIGIVAYWFNRGQGVVARQLRSALDDLGYETFVLARPTRKTNIRPDWVASDGVWDQDGVTRAEDYLISDATYSSWIEANSIEAVMFDQNYQFDEIRRLRESGVTTIGRFVWEHFAHEHVEPATAAFDRIYSMTACERQRYSGMGIESPRVRWGCHPSLIEAAISPEERRAASLERVELLFPGGFMSKRKPLAETIEAFRAAEGPGLRLVLKAQVERQAKKVRRMARGGRIGRRDKRIELRIEEVPTRQYLAMMASAAAVIAPSRWEGLGLHLYEATALGVPVITNDDPPMNEIVIDGRNGLLVGSDQDGTARSGIPSYRPRVPDLTAAIERMTDPSFRAELDRGARERRQELSWETTKGDLQELIGAATA